MAELWTPGRGIAFCIVYCTILKSKEMNATLLSSIIPFGSNCSFLVVHPPPVSLLLGIRLCTGDSSRIIPDINLRTGRVFYVTSICVGASGMATDSNNVNNETNAQHEI